MQISRLYCSYLTRYIHVNTAGTGLATHTGRGIGVLIAAWDVTGCKAVKVGAIDRV